MAVSAECWDAHSKCQCVLVDRRVRRTATARLDEALGVIGRGNRGWAEADRGAGVRRSRAV